MVEPRGVPWIADAVRTLPLVDNTSSPDWQQALAVLGLRQRGPSTPRLEPDSYPEDTSATPTRPPPGHTSGDADTAFDELMDADDAVPALRRIAREPMTTTGWQIAALPTVTTEHLDYVPPHQPLLLLSLIARV